MTSRRITTAELLSIGSELTVGETVDTNAGEVGRALTELGVRVGRITGLPDDLETVAEAFRTGLARADLLVSTGGLGPTPDDLTREAVALACGETVAVDPGILAWLEGLWARRGMPFPEANIKQAWLIPSAESLPNPNGTAPGWFVTRPDGRLIVTLPGPPREMRPMWADEVMPRLRARGLGMDAEHRTLRLTGIGESQVADLLGEAILRRPNPIVATYARAEAVDVRISARAEGTAGAPGALELVEAAEAEVLAILERYVWARGSTTWSQAVGAALDRRGWTLAAVEHGTGGALVTLFGEVPWLLRATVHAADGSRPVAPVSEGSGVGDGVADEDLPSAAAAAAEPGADPLLAEAEAARAAAGTPAGLAMSIRPRDVDTAVSIAIVTPNGRHRRRRIAFQRGDHGRSRAAIAAAAALLEILRAE